MTPTARTFDATVMPHLHAAYNLARWLLRDDRSAEDAVQEAYLRAFRFFKDVRGEDVRPWLLGIVRNACHDWLRQNRHLDDQVEFDEVRDSDAIMAQADASHADPLILLDHRDQAARVNQAIADLAPAFREVIVLRELEEMSYEDIARVAGVPVGTVMSRLSRARAMLRKSLQGERPATTATTTASPAALREMKA
ncbi:sigma-70 family RNA polymerase sigma factor [Variovorax sp. dw_954]|uniref:sigma-70 family RNA polymerase sigma factor n=1 Tax=Variovorax sp. dw_954 TaxID=2720078 RepID=UPI001BD31DFE|nr:sigma-70 family RNA polymerase sigma factor [Variovorax sp. dw_954]